ncbi:MAG TPA: protein translocase subunit SecF [Candidatus Polarisedimenticolia bacterium]|nr:protein translocase subunit SecF [Candidatus Polarisedimenticolia bacterium]
MELFRKTQIDFLGPKWYFITVSVIAIAISAISLLTRGLTYGIDFRGGADVVLRFVEDPAIDEVRSALEHGSFGGAQIQKLRLPEDPTAHDLLVRVPPQGGNDETPGEEKDVSGLVLAALRSGLAAKTAAEGKLDLNLSGAVEIKKALLDSHPGQESMASAAASLIADYRNANGGLLKSVDEAVSISGVPAEAVSWLRANAVVGGYTIRSVDYVGPSVGKELKSKATYAIIGSLFAMLAYIWFRFERLSFGVSAILTLAHDALLALGAVSLTGKEFDLTVLAAILTIVGYSVNDTIVIFDRVRENLSHRRTGDLQKLFNESINQTLGRTILTSLLVLMVVLTLWLFGGSRLNPFSFTLLVGVISGTYSTIYISAPIVIWMEQLKAKRAPVRG